VSGFPSATQQRKPGARQRILTTAAELFASGGIRAVGVDHLISHASVTKATFYKHFGSKDRVVCESLSAAAQEHYAAFERTMVGATTPRAALAALADSLPAAAAPAGREPENGALWPHQLRLRGSLFVYAAVEYTDSEHPVRIIVASHYSALSQQFQDLVRQLGHPRPAEAVDDLLVAYIGALTWGNTTDPSAAAQACRRGFDRVCDEALLPGARPVELGE
jgi:AcrR family transcriptional regulator